MMPWKAPHEPLPMAMHDVKRCMNLSLRYAVQSELALELPENTVVTRCEAPRGKPLADVAAAVDRALADPLELPALKLAVVPGDQVVLALEPRVPAAEIIVARTIRALL